MPFSQMILECSSNADFFDCPQIVHIFKQDVILKVDENGCIGQNTYPKIPKMSLESEVQY